MTSLRKYRNKKISYNGQVFDSKKEYRRYRELLLLQKANQIEDLDCQTKFVLIPGQRDISEEVYKRGPKKGQPKPGNVIEKECAYYADFTYKEKGELVVEDTKGVKTEAYKIKKKMMLYFYGIRIREV